MLKIRIFRPSTAARARDVRRTCPPPSPMLPSISIIFLRDIRPFFKEGACQTGLPMESLRLALEKSEDMSFGCLIDQSDRLVASSFGLNSRILQQHLAESSTRITGKSPIQSNHWITQEMIRRFEGAKDPKSVKLNKSFVSTHQARVCAVLEQIPTGKVTTYGLISNHIGSAPRAVGGAVGSNPWSIFVPCHRVVPSSLVVGNYSMCGALGESGGSTKRKLLTREEVPINQDKINSAALWDPSEGY